MGDHTGPKEIQVELYCPNCNDYVQTELIEVSCDHCGEVWLVAEDLKSTDWEMCPRCWEEWDEQMSKP